MDIADFIGGPSWCFHFRGRALSIRTRTTISQQLPADYAEKLEFFRSYYTKKMADKNIQPQHITNMNEVLLTFDILVKQTMGKMGTSMVSVRTTGHEKSCFPDVLACQADGQKLPPMVILKQKTLPKEKFPASMIIKANPKGWMDEDRMAAWLREMYTKRWDGFFHTSPAMLICDSMRAHLTDTIKIQVKRMNMELTIMPGGLTKQLQPLCAL